MGPSGQLLGAVAFAVLAVACASIRREPHRDLERVWREYRALPEQRALAIAGDPRRDRWVSGASGGRASQQEAREEALAECRRRRARRRIMAACEIYAVGDEIVWEGP